MPALPDPEPASAPAPLEPGAPSATPRTRIYAVLGGIASGKSEVARLLADQGGLVLAADEIAHEVLASEEVLGRVVERFGPGILDADGRPDRARLAARVFGPSAAPEDREALEGWIHPPVRARILERLSRARAEGRSRVVLDVPLLFENDARHGLVRLCDTLVFVESDAAERDLRAQRQRGWARGEVARREAAQMSLEEKRARADHILPNHGDLAELRKAVRELLTRLERHRGEPDTGR